VREIRLYWKRVLKRIDMTSRSLFALIEPGSCFAGTLAELVFAADRALMFAGTELATIAEARLSCLPLNFGAYADGQRPHAPGDPLPRRARQRLDRAEARSANRSTPRTPRRWASSPPPMTRSIGTTRCA
jgi:hypothetical protein